MPMTLEEALERIAFLERKLAETRNDLDIARKNNKAYARENVGLWTRFYQDERTIKTLRARRNVA